MTTGNGRDPRVTSLEEVRRQRAEQAKAAGKSARPSASRQSLKGQIFGLAMIAMAVGFIVWLLGGLGGIPVPSGEGQ